MSRVFKNIILNILISVVLTMLLHQASKDTNSDLLNVAPNECTLIDTFIL